MRYLFAFALAVALLATSGPANAQQPPSLPPGDGLNIVAVACTQCHGPAVFMQLRQGPEAWRRTVYDMVNRGAQVQASEIEPAVNYFAAHFGMGNNVPATAEVSLPEGGKILVEQRCTLCHSLVRAAGTKRARAEWQAIVSQMILLGAPISKADAQTITSYLQGALILDPN